MTDLTKYYIDLSKCSQEQQQYIFSLLPDKEDEKQYEITGVFKYLHYDEIAEYWFVDSLTSFNKTELTYPEFIKLFEGGERETENQFKVETAQLQADKAELVEMLKIFVEENTPISTSHEYEFPEHMMKAKSLIQKHEIKNP